MSLQISISNSIRGYRSVPGGVPVDPDAQAFITAASITDPTQQAAINQYYTPIIDRIKPIELPSDEEIRKRGWEDADAEDDIAFFVGAKWMKEQILGKEDKTFKQKSKWTEVDNATRRLK